MNIGDKEVEKYKKHWNDLISGKKQLGVQNGFRQ
jgi:hypothetical protein